MDNFAENSVAEVLRRAATKLEPCSLTPRLDAEVLMSYAIQTNRASLHAWPEKKLSSSRLREIETLIEKRSAGHPVAYLTGVREFWAMEFHVNPSVLIPRPETELLVEIALDIIPATDRCLIADLGTGCGAIAIALAQERPNIAVHACDNSKKALITAKNNARKHGINNISFFVSNWLSSFPDRKYDLILGNPPYIAENDPHLALGDVRFEPKAALRSGNDGFKDLNTILRTARYKLTKNGSLVLEHGYDQMERLTWLFRTHGYSNIRRYQDLQGHPRAIAAQWNRGGNLSLHV